MCGHTVCEYYQGQLNLQLPALACEVAGTILAQSFEGISNANT